MTSTSAQVLSGWLHDLGAPVPAPGGGAAAAVMAALGAGLAGMVAGYSTGEVGGFEASRADAARMAGVQVAARALAERGLEVADEDARASAGFAAAFRLPSSTATEVRERASAVDVATLAAAQASVEVGHLAGQVLAQLEGLVTGSNPVVLADVGVGAAAVAGALRAAALTTEANLAAAAGTGHGATLSAEVGALDAAADRAEAVVAAVRAALRSSGT